jgi:serine/threonine protein kinase
MNDLNYSVLYSVLYGVLHCSVIANPLESLLQYDPQDRLTAREAMDHPYIKSIFNENKDNNNNNNNNNNGDEENNHMQEG